MGNAIILKRHVDYVETFISRVKITLLSILLGACFCFGAVYLVSGPAFIFEGRILQGSILTALAFASMYTVNRILNH